jgi:anthranilate synthase component 2
MHGIATPIKVTEPKSLLFNGLPEIFKVGRYHSWVVSREGLPEELQITAIDERDQSIMALSHRTYDVHGVQFHPESVLTEYGKVMMQNWCLSPAVEKKENAA